MLPFEICVDDANPWTIMAAYNDVNGVAATEHDEVEQRPPQVRMGLGRTADVGLGRHQDDRADRERWPGSVMPGPRGPWGAALVDAVRAGAVAEATIDDHLARLLRLAGRVGALHGIPPEAERTLGPQVEPTDPSLRLALRTLAASGMVLLKGQDVLPLDEARIGDTAPLVLVGRHAIQTALQGGGSASVRPPHEISIADGLSEALGAARLRVVDGVTVRQNPPAAVVDLIMDPQTGAPGVRITSFDKSGKQQAST